MCAVLQEQQLKVLLVKSCSGRTPLAEEPPVHHAAPVHNAYEEHFEQVSGKTPQGSAAEAAIMRAKAVELAALHTRLTALAKSEAECVPPILLHCYSVLLCRGVLIKHAVTKMQTSAASIGHMADPAYVCHINGAGRRSASAEYLVSVTQLVVPGLKAGDSVQAEEGRERCKGREGRA